MQRQLARSVRVVQEQREQPRGQRRHLVLDRHTLLSAAAVHGLAAGVHLRHTAGQVALLGLAESGYTLRAGQPARGGAQVLQDGDQVPRTECTEAAVRDRGGAEKHWS